LPGGTEENHGNFQLALNTGKPLPTCVISIYRSDNNNMKCSHRNSAYFSKSVLYVPIINIVLRFKKLREKRDTKLTNWEFFCCHHGPYMDAFLGICLDFMVLYVIWTTFIQLLNQVLVVPRNQRCMYRKILNKLELYVF
jgi:hypothetical protein